MATLNLSRLKEKLVKALTPWFLGREQDALIEAIKTGGEETLLAVDVDTAALQAQFTNLYSNAGATAIGIADAGGYFSGINVEAALQQVGATLIGGVFQAADADLTAISAVTGTNTYIKRTGVNVWTQLTPTQVKSDIGLSNVDNTSDANKPVSTAQAAADTAAKARANHTGTQLANTISDFSAAADARVAAGITGKLDVTAKAADSELLDGIDSSRVVYGFGTNKISSYGANWNTAMPSGFYEAESAINGPVAGWNWSINVRHGNETLPGGQYGFQLNNPIGTNELHMRGVQAGTWNAWTRLLQSNEMSEAAVINTIPRRTSGGYIYATYFNSVANDIGSNTPSHLAVQTFGDGFIRWMTPSNFFTLYNVAGLTNTTFSGNTTASVLFMASGAGSYFLGNGSGTQYNGTMYFNGLMYNLASDGSVWVRIPRTFVQATDPGAQAQDGDLWFW